MAKRPQGLVEARISAANLVLNALGRKSDSLSRTVSSTDPLITELLHVTDLSWRARADAGSNYFVLGETRNLSFEAITTGIRLIEGGRFPN